MQLAWDSSKQLIRLSNGQLSGVITSDGDYAIDLRGTEDVTLCRWLEISRTISIDSTGSKLMSWTIEGEGDEHSSDFLILDPLQDGRLLIHFDAIGPEWDSAVVESVVRQICEANGDTLNRTTYFDGFWNFEIICTADERTTRQMFSLQAAFRRMFRLPGQLRPTGGIQADGAYHLLKAGGARFLLGISESDWLEVKSRAYDLDSFAGRVELAQDVARFANATEPALLMLGFRTKRQGGSDVIDRVTPIDTTSSALVRYRDTIDRLVYPQIEGLTVDSVSYGEGSIIAICIPAQAESMKPYLVHGAVVDGKNEGAFISIIQRRAEGSIPMSIAEVHALLAAGRSVLRGMK